LGDPFAVFTYQNEVKGSHSIEVIYFAKLADPHSEPVMNPEDHSSCGWFSEAELPQTFVSEKDLEDDEVKAIYKGFALLKRRVAQFCCEGISMTGYLLAFISYSISIL
jgi:hypothetical protein